MDSATLHHIELMMSSETRHSWFGRAINVPYQSPMHVLTMSCACMVHAPGEFVSGAYGDAAWSSVLHELGLAHQWSEAWLPTCPNPDRLMIE